MKQPGWPVLANRSPTIPFGMHRTCRHEPRSTGPFHAVAERSRTLPVAPIAGAVLIAGGAAATLGGPVKMKR